MLIAVSTPQIAQAVPANALDAAWQVWIAKGRSQDRQRLANQVRAMEWFSIAALLAMAVVFYGPGVPGSLGGAWRNVVMASLAMPFVALLTWSRTRTAKGKANA